MRLVLSFAHRTNTLVRQEDAAAEMPAGTDTGLLQAQRSQLVQVGNHYAARLDIAVRGGNSVFDAAKHFTDMDIALFQLCRQPVDELLFIQPFRADDVRANRVWIGFSSLTLASPTSTG